ncbi:TPA: CopG family transcriptional regulator [Streptococcus suis]|nr:CopG family transcriptional regulator [Streptococcus suis]HEL1766899.1 CopG family transcriptional regulator [Streptococcus suis]HEM5495915.1 CopG family transcriptional regulator [Streptococcus suis]
MKRRLTITLSDSVLENLKKMAKEMGLSKSAMIAVALENYKKGQEK